VQLRPIGPPELPRCDLVHGTPIGVVAGDLGYVALFAPDEIVAYRLRWRRSTRLFVFRTLDVDDRFAAAVPGVRPGVRLLIELRTTGRVRVARRLFAHVVETKRSLSDLPDSFLLRVGSAIAGRQPTHLALLSLLVHTNAPALAGFSRAPSDRALRRTP
jgi:hypothetical protein